MLLIHHCPANIEVNYFDAKKIKLKVVSVKATISIAMVSSIKINLAKILFMKKMIPLFTLLVCSLATYAQPLFTETFNYGGTAGSIVTLSAGKWLENTSGGSTNPVQYDPSASLVFPTFPAGTGRLALGNTGQDITGALSSAVTSGNLYATMLVNFSSTTTTGDYFFHFSQTTTTNTYTGRSFVKSSATAGKINFGLMKNSGGTVPYSTNEYNINSTYCLIVKYAFNAVSTTDDVVTLYVFDATSGLPVTEPAGNELSATINTDATSIAAIGLRQGAATAGASGLIDNVFVTTSWSDIFAALPVKLASFTSQKINAGIQLNWQSTSELNFGYYEVEKSIDGKNFNSIGTIHGKASNGNGASYTFTDAAIIADKQYYRLKMVDKDGTIKYSYILMYNNKQLLTLSVYPNPVVNTIVITHPKITEGAMLQILSAEGKLIKNIPVQVGTTQSTSDIGNLPKGSYLIMFTSNDGKTTVRFVK
jgi:Secretion system C-terminal sorting domain